MQIGIYDGSHFNVKFDEKSTFLGGSETWMLEIAKSLAKLGHEVFLFGNFEFHTYGTIYFLKKSKLKEICEIVDFDKFIFSRGIENISYIKSKDISLIVHDEFPCSGFNDFDKLNKIYLLSDYHKKLFIKKYGNTEKTEITFNGINLDLYNKKEIKTNSMVWSSCFERGLDFFINYVYPKIKKEVPDFELKICNYNKYNVNYPNIKYLGQLSKNDLAKEQLKAKIWCYPNLGFAKSGNSFKETFCITAVENAAAGNCILTTELGGLGTTCKGIEFLSNEFYENERIKDLEKYSSYLADMCIKALKDDFHTSFDYKKYTWDNAAKSLL